MHSARLAAEAGTWAYFVDEAKHFFMPALTLIIVGIGSLMRYTRTNTLEVLNADYIRTARAITETLFSIQGIGFASYHAMIAGDIPFTMFYLSFISILTLLGNLLADILYAVVDPRVRVN